MVCEHLQLGVGNIPVLVGGALFEHLLVLDHVVHFVLTAYTFMRVSGRGKAYMPEAMV